MGFLSLFNKAAPTLMRLPSGSFTVDREGRVLMGTLPSSFPTELVGDIAQQVLAAHRTAARDRLHSGKRSLVHVGLGFGALSSCHAALSAI